ncbi:PD-(D/E)XK nuclease superfamily protein [Rubritalea squalenifaciens DSM 18772]|uniref:PD-(D/E)XK nuclease superfamily protein n=1 Tax=Rubritalea squalenifaciens DSM 18772 TaxID=1123071 RepID=A0A1M6ME22_9BACT|nr:PD-(D/E)XK nuclease family protein [Rubritalea squalenifaciens]SHJ81709.1 PD-(D/E)XK nuclease superfamily protein [Rubritalea squalenifaciens DSM 18772]
MASTIRVMQGELDFGVQVKREFLGWESPLLNLLVDWLMIRRDELAEMAVVVPTGQSGRRLREALARSGGVLAPKVMTIGSLSKRTDVSKQIMDLAAWVKVLRKSRPEDFRGLFPKDPLDGASEGFGWALSMGRQLADLRWDLEDCGVSVREAGWKSMESERWEDLSSLDQQVTQQLKKWGQPKTLSELNLGAGVKQVVLAGICELGSVTRSDLKSLSGRDVLVTALVHAPEFLKSRFDEWGCPNDSWCEEEIPMQDWKDKIRVVEDPALAAQYVVRKVGRQSLRPEELGLGLCDRELGISLQRAFGDAGWKLYDPDGKSVEASNVVQFLRLLLEWLKPWRPIKAFRSMLNLVEMEGFLPEGANRYLLVKELDEYLEKRLPESSTDTVGRMPAGHLRSAMEVFLDETRKLEEGSGVRALRGWVARILGRGDREVAKVLVEPLAEVFEVLEGIESKEGSMQVEHAVEYLLEASKGLRVYGDLEGAVLNMEGWLELIYDPAPHVFLVGMHEGAVPESLPENSFLPENFKESIGMPGAKQRYARDSYLMHALWESRASVDVVVCKVNDAGDPKTVSRLLLRTSGQDLAERVKLLFGEAQEKAPNPSAWTRDWKLKILERDNPYRVEDNEKVRTLSPSALRDYLKCPFRFYLKRVLKMERYQAGKMELNAMDFGNVVHEVVETFGRDEEIRESTKAQEIAAYFDAVLDRVLESRYGSEPSLAIRIQVESARERLRALAHKQADQRADGWRIQHVEFSIGERKEGKESLPWQVGGHPVNMVLDRVDRHEVTGQIRILDYKTSAKAKTPMMAHLTKWVEEECRPLLGELLPLATGRGKKLIENRWKDLQLPLYAWFAMEHFKSDEIPEIGYINLPKAVSETEFSLWSGFDEVLLDSAKEWTLGAVKGIEEGRFFEPAELPRAEQEWDEFHLLAMDGIREAFDFQEM